MAERLLNAFEEIRAELDRDSLFAEGHFTTDLLARLLNTASDTDLGRLFSHTLQGMIQSARYGGIKVVRRMLRDKPSTRGMKSLSISKDAVLFVEGNLDVAGDVENAGILVVGGNIAIGGN